jgi:polyisoprenyl-phosphate glycosyltransferase
VTETSPGTVDTRPGEAAQAAAAAAGAETDGIGLTVVVPCYNEAASIERTYAEIAREVSRYDAELLFVDDGSTDDTLTLLKGLAQADPWLKYLSFSRNFGLEAAFSAGFTYAGKPWIVQLDADLQSPPSEIHRLVQTALAGDYDAVFGVRPNRQDHILRRMGSRAQHWVARRVLGIELPPGGSTFRVVRASLAKKIVTLRLGTPYFMASLTQMGGRYTTVATEHRRRDAGRSRFAVRQLFSSSLDLFFGFSYRPLIVLYAAAVCGVLASLAVPALTSVSTAVTILVILNQSVLLGLAVLARYVMVVLRELRPRRYLVREANVEVAPVDLLYEHEHEPAGVLAES